MLLKLRRKPKASFHPEYASEFRSAVHSFSLDLPTEEDYPGCDQSRCAEKGPENGRAWIRYYALIVFRGDT